MIYFLTEEMANSTSLVMFLAQNCFYSPGRQQLATALPDDGG